MDLDFFKKTRILDGGMGQELLSKGLISKGTLWSASAILDKKFHNLVVETHLSFINSGADVILTNTFSTRKIRLIKNKVEEHFNYVNEQSCLLAIEAKKDNPKHIINCMSKLHIDEDPSDVKIPKVVTDNNNNLLYASRGCVPMNKNGLDPIIVGSEAYKQVCIYGFSKEQLNKFHSDNKTSLESVEDIEIVRFLEKGMKVKII